METIEDVEGEMNEDGIRVVRNALCSQTQINKSDSVVTYRRAFIYLFACVMNILPTNFDLVYFMFTNSKCGPFGLMCNKNRNKVRKDEVRQCFEEEEAENKPFRIEGHFLLL